SSIYRQYRETMHARSMFDFDDMILDFIAAIEAHPRLRHDLQEQFQYVLVDEFQDTNNAQMRVIRLIADAPVFEGKPNIMVVGDDDQAVYKFQGAELSNILNFRTSFTDVAVVNMTSNYRSTQDILDIATHVIRKGEHRLENLIPQLEKTLVASNPEIKNGSIIHKVFDTSLHELHYVSRRIRRLIESGVSPNDIAVISSKHRQLEALVPYMKGAGVPIKYEREQNVFLEPHIAQLILLGRFINSVAAKNQEEADEYLPRILAFPFWQLKRSSIWRISKDAYANRKSWLETMMESEDLRVRSIADFLVGLGESAPDEPLESLLDRMIGVHVQLVQENEDEEIEAGLLASHGPDGEFLSPFKSYYFNKDRFDHARAEYLSFLSSLRVFVKALREYKGKSAALENLKLQDMIDFVDIHQKNGVALNDQSPFANSTNAVHLLSAHKSKGLEFDTVFVLSCTDEIWAGRGGSKKISLPANMPIEPAGESDDDKLRLFYVALTRAKKNLYMTSYKVKDDGKESLTLRFLTSDAELHDEVLKKLYAPEQGDEETFKETYTPETHELLTASWVLYHTPPFFGEEHALLKSVLENYQLSVTHLNNFLNVAKGGPQLFLEQNLLRFPQAKSPSGSYGTAVHKTLEKAGICIRAEGRKPEKSEFIGWFNAYLAHERLSKSDLKLFGDRGQDALSAFYDQKIDSLSADDLLEVNFKNQGVILSCAQYGQPKKTGESHESYDAHLAGKIDRMVKVPGGEYEVHDYKTGKAKQEWAGKDEYEKIKLYEYSRQLMFYKILVEHSRDYASNRVGYGVLDFVEPLKNGTVASLRLDIEKELCERTKRLVCIVFNKIMNLDFPDVAGRYDPTLEGIKQFEDDLLEGKI
ncbi:MAG TPA: ATP-dependent DNA helicase, partial [Candidatus Paceibacterota bacterium]